MEYEQSFYEKGRDWAQRANELYDQYNLERDESRRLLLHLSHIDAVDKAGTYFTWDEEQSGKTIAVDPSDELSTGNH